MRQRVVLVPESSKVQLLCVFSLYPHRLPPTSWKQVCRCIGFFKLPISVSLCVVPCDGVVFHLGVYPSLASSVLRIESKSASL